MDKIEIGEYVRSDKGYIWKETSENFSQILTKSGLVFGNLAKHSKNIIELIEVCDYVNGYKVISVDYDVIDNNTDCIELDLNNNYQYNFISINQIKSIVTKEMIKTVEYKVGM